MQINKAYYFKLCPDKTQQEQLEKYANATRFIYNWFLSQNIQIHKANQKFIQQKAQDKQMWTY